MQCFYFLSYLLNAISCIIPSRACAFGIGIGNIGDVPLGGIVATTLTQEIPLTEQSTADEDVEVEPLFSSLLLTILWRSFPRTFPPPTSTPDRHQRCHPTCLVDRNCERGYMRLTFVPILPRSQLTFVLSFHLLLFVHHMQ